MSEQGTTTDELSTSERVTDYLQSIADTGIVEISWEQLQQALRSRLEIVIGNYKEKDNFKDEDEYQEPNVEKFNLDNSRNGILELIASFNEPPFTIQRICELLHSPFEYYDRVSAFLRGLEKNLRVISSNDWPKCPVTTTKDIETPMTTNSHETDGGDSQHVIEESIEAVKT